ncbi:hypothetical protein B0T17DRAFT_351410 [Bombardia bombarda]|uniref:Zn(2)-C6 fungal-type domain-containing protein n=1 Tax=Bombardia bombarda TaxID=252184 RepID=A0AA39WHV8_9PEZI|nr:hypothetical protein B0T17DRAFT_351410 [Bombardia bombarda]
MADSIVAAAQEGAAFVDGKVAKLRASCDACNESKVRCSQAKPKCARCEKQGMMCIYGLSRRSHKSAPRIGEMQTARGGRGHEHGHGHGHATTPPSPTAGVPQAILDFKMGSSPPVTRSYGPLYGGAGYGRSSGSSSSSTRHRHSHHHTTSSSYSSTGSISGSGSGAPSIAGTASTTTTVSPADTTGHDASSARVAPGLLHDFDMYVQQATDSIDVSTSLGFSLDHMDAMSSAAYDSFLDMELGNPMSLPSPSDHDMGASSYSAFIASGDWDKRPSFSESNPCSCTSRVIDQLQSIPTSFQHQNASFDVQLAQLRRAIKLAEDSIRCDCASWDEMAIMTIGILVGRVVEGFETSLSKASPSTGPSNSGTAGGSSSGQSSGAIAPKLSWGVLQIEHEDEEDLRQHLWLWQFQKLERLLNQFSASVRRARIAHGAAKSAHVKACEGMYIWLEQKSRLVREQYFTQDAASGSAMLGSRKQSLR